MGWWCRCSGWGENRAQPPTTEDKALQHDCWGGEYAQRQACAVEGYALRTINHCLSAVYGFYAFHGRYGRPGDQSGAVLACAATGANAPQPGRGDTAVRPRAFAAGVAEVTPRAIPDLMWRHHDHCSKDSSGAVAAINGSSSTLHRQWWWLPIRLNNVTQVELDTQFQPAPLLAILIAIFTVHLSFFVKIGLLFPRRRSHFLSSSSFGEMGGFRLPAVIG